MILAEGVSLLAFVYAGLSLPLLILIGATVFVLSMKNPSWGVYILLGELFFGSRGRLLDYGFVSLRMVVFTAVLLAWIVKQFPISPPSEDLPKGDNFQFPIKSLIHNSKFIVLYLLLLVVIGFGIIWGIVNGNGLVNVWGDANGYLYLLIFPVVLLTITAREQIDKVLQILAAAVVLVALKTLILFVWFAGDFNGVATLYHWIINQDIGEITGIVGSASRIFMQSQFYSLAGLFVFGALLFPSLRGSFSDRSNPKKEYEIASSVRLRRTELAMTKAQLWLVFVSALFAVIMSLSRSFWLGGLFAAIFILAVLLYKKAEIKKIAKFAGIIILIAAMELVGIFGLTKVLSGGVSETVLSRVQNPASEAAGNARLLLLPKLLDGIAEAPILGSGFGRELSYKSFLPDRMSPQNPDGEITSFAFEWGYLDMALKFGFLGLLIYLFFIANIFARGWNKLRSTDHGLLTTGLLAGLVALAVLNVTTPYLNHPLGIGYLILSALAFRDNEQAAG